MGKDVVIVDDDGDLLDALAELIESTGCRVWKARSVAELMSLGPRALSCDLALLDVNLGRAAPGGLEALGWLISQRFSGRAIFLTGHAATFPEVEEARARAGVQLLLKPLNSDELLSLLGDRQ